MHLIVYTSEFVAGQEDINEVLSDIIKHAKINNPKLGITGLLFYHNQRFLQIIEGDKDSLEQLMAKLAKDKRHKNVERIIDQEINKRGFDQWNMDSFNLSEGDKLDPTELIKIRDAYKKNVLIDSETLVKFYKAMLSSHYLSPEQDE